MTCAERYAKLKAEHRCVDCKIQLSASNKFTKCDHCREYDRLYKKRPKRRQPSAKPVDSPLDTVTTKDRFALVTIHGEEYIITDIKMRMLQPRELFNAQGFPADYIIDHDDSGKPYPKSKQTARCGNAVTPPVPAALVRANLPEMCREAAE